MKIEDLKDKKITVMGLGLHGGGVGTVRFLVSAGAKVIVTDLKSKIELAPSLEKLKDLKGVEYVLGQHRTEDFTKVDMVIKTPPAPWTSKHIKLALENKIPVEIDSSLFFKLCPNPIMGVTGTRGKTTTASLIFEILKVAGKNPIKVGIGQVSVLDKLKELKKDSVVVFELSSWRLSALGRHKLSPKVAVITNVFPDHLNYYKSMTEYVADKKNIFLNQKASDFCVINEDNEILKNLEAEIKAEVIKFSMYNISNGKTVYIEDEAIYLNNGIDTKKIINVADVKIRGRHNLGNIMAAIGVAQALGIKMSDVKKAIAQFTGLPHRLEFVRELNGAKYYNDTSATSPDGAISGLNSFTEPIILIAGGSDKNLDMTAWAQAIHEKAKGVIFLKGEATDKIISALQKIRPEDGKFVIVESMDKAVELAKISADAGDVVLLSPGAASFGLFLNEFDRGNKFKEAVKGLK
ncbi:MAG: UDP-N-acetylmuramoyl-L-alanine--D-glutamate ligase [Parcubacteria group bacterium]|jgi:UDP-N-acetylmuramoylalanine--D-glutamate ligase